MNMKEYSFFSPPWIFLLEEVSQMVWLTGNFSYLMGFEIQHTLSHVCFGGFIHSFSKYLLCTYYEPLTGLAPGDVALTEVDHSPTLMVPGSWTPNLMHWEWVEGQCEVACLHLPHLMANRTLRKGYWGSWSFYSVDSGSQIPVSHCLLHWNMSAKP